MTVTLTVADVATIPKLDHEQEIELGALEFAWRLGGRASGAGLLVTRVPF